MKKLLLLVLATFLTIQGTFAQADADNDISTKTLDQISELEDVPAGTQDLDFEGILPPARLECVDGESEASCAKRNEDYAQEKAGELGRKIENGTLELRDIPIFIVKAIDLFTKLAGSITVLMMMYAGFQYMFGEMLDTKEQAKTTIKYALAGLVVTFLSWLVVNIVKTQLTGVDYYGNLVEQQKN